jgi:hypothetical protein
MTEGGMIQSSGHIETLRLFDASRGDLQGRFKLEEWELAHLAICNECQHVREVFGRQFTTLKPKVSPDKAA